MNSISLAPCGLVCELCLGYQRNENKCVGCIPEGNKPKHCQICSIKNCPEKSNPEDLCLECGKFPCRRLRDLEKRYALKYGESPTENMQIVRDRGFDEFSRVIQKKWTCTQCGNLLSAHRETCLLCGAINKNFPAE